MQLGARNRKGTGLATRATLVGRGPRGSGTPSLQAFLLSPAGISTWVPPAVLGCLVVIYISVNFTLPRLFAGDLNIYLVQPLMWSALAILAYIGLRFGAGPRILPVKGALTAAAMVGASQVAVSVIAGLLYGFGHSPYGHRPLVLLGNLIYVASGLVGVEVTRAYMAAFFDQRSRTLALAIPTMVFVFLGIPAARIDSVSDLLGAFQFTGESLLPLAAENLLATVLVLAGGPLAAIVYRGILLAFEWLSPILPNLRWTLTAFVGTMTPILVMFLVADVLQPGKESDRSRARDDRVRRPTSWTVAAALVVAVIWLNTGFFGVRPTLVSGVSMEPALVAGDVAITRDVAASEVRVGDIIRFREGDVYILHRVIDIQPESDAIEFTTQGDANNLVDAPVQAHRLEGKVILVVPKIGWIGIGIRTLVDWLL